MELQEYLNRKEYAIKNYDTYFAYCKNNSFVPIDIKKLEVILHDLQDDFLTAYFDKFVGLPQTTRNIKAIINNKKVNVTEDLLNNIEKFIKDNKNFLLINEIKSNYSLQRLFCGDNYDKEKDVFKFKVVNLDYHNDDTLKEFNDFFKLLDTSNNREYFELVKFKNSIRLKLHKETINLLDKFVLESDFLQNVKSSDYTERLKVKILNLLNV
jgi:hypothetical protein